MDPVGGTVSHRLNVAPPNTCVGRSRQRSTCQRHRAACRLWLSNTRDLQVSVIGDTSSLTTGTPRNMMQALGDDERFLRVSRPPRGRRETHPAVRRARRAERSAVPPGGPRPDTSPCVRGPCIKRPAEREDVWASRGNGVQYVVRGYHRLHGPRLVSAALAFLGWAGSLALAFRESRGINPPAGRRRLRGRTGSEQSVTLA
jgi:hypothetical protein